MFCTSALTIALRVNHECVYIKDYQLAAKGEVLQLDITKER